MKKKVQGEIIWRVTYQIDATEDKPRPEPVILILADSKGWKWLANEFVAMSKKIVSKAMIAVDDAEDHQHINAGFYKTINKRLSHPLELKLGLLTRRTRRHVLRKYHVDKLPASDTDMRPLFRRLIKSSEKQIRQMKW